MENIQECFNQSKLKMKLSIKLFSGIPVLADDYRNPKSIEINKLFWVNDNYVVDLNVRYEDGVYGCAVYFKDFKSEEVEHSYIGKLRFQRFIQSSTTPYQYILKIERIAQTGFCNL